MESKQQMKQSRLPEAGSETVLESILSTRIEQMISITLPSDTRRLEILKAIEAKESFSERLACFLDYLINQNASLNTEILMMQHSCPKTGLSLNEAKSV